MYIKISSCTSKIHISFAITQCACKKHTLCYKYMDILIQYVSIYKGMKRQRQK